MIAEYIANEKWKEIKGVPNYYVSDQGRIRSINNYIKPQLNKRTGLYQAMTYVNGKAKLLNIQNTVGTHFLPEPPEEGMIIRHISKDLSDNRVENLRWAYRGKDKNIANGIFINGAKPPKRIQYKYIIKQYTCSGLCFATYVGFEELEKLGFKRYAIISVSNGKYYKNTYKGYYFKVEKIKID